MVQIMYAKIKIMMQDILPLPPMSGREFPLHLSSVDFKQSIENLVFCGSSLPALLCIPYSGRICLVQQLSFWLLWKSIESMADTPNSFELIRLTQMLTDVDSMYLTTYS